MSTATASKNKDKKKPASPQSQAKAKAIKPAAKPAKPALRTKAPEGCPHPIDSVFRAERKLIRRSHTNPRTVFVLDDLLATMEIRTEDGTRVKRQQQPILVRYRPDEETGTLYEIIDGERRDRTAEHLGWDDIEVKLVEWTDEEVEEAQLVANLARADLTPLDEANGFDRMWRRGYSVEQIADRVGKRADYVRHRMALVGLTDEVKTALREEQITLGAALEFATVTDADEQRKAVAEALAQRAAGADPVSAKAARFIAGRYHLTLAKAPFALDDASLVPEAGACTTCPRRSSAQFQLIALPGAQSEDERCTDRACFETKQEALWMRVVADAEKKGLRVIDGGAEAKKFIIFGRVPRDSGMVDLDALCDQTRDGKSWREHLGDRLAPTLLVRSDAGSAPHYLAPKDEALTALREAGIVKAQQQPATAQPAAAPSEPAADTRDRFEHVTVGDEPARASKASDAVPSSEPAPESDDAPSSKPAVMSTADLVEAASKWHVNSTVFEALLRAFIITIDPSNDEAESICRRRGELIPKNRDGADIVLDLADALSTDGERIGLCAEVCSIVNTKARTALSDFFSSGAIDVTPAAGASTDEDRVLEAIRSGKRKRADILAATGITTAQWTRISASLEAAGKIRHTGDRKATAYFIVEPAEEPAHAESFDPEVTADHAPEDESAEQASPPEPELSESVIATVTDVLQSGAQDRSALAEAIVDLEGVSHTEAERAIEELIRRGVATIAGKQIELVQE